MKNQRIYPLLLAFLFCSASFAQNAVVDSLKKLINTNVADTVKLKALSDLNWEMATINAAQSKQYGFDELKLATKIADQKWISMAYNDIGISCYKMGLLDSALFYYTKSYEIRKKLNDKNLIGTILSKIAVIEHELGNYNRALELQFQVLKTFEALGNERYMGMTFNNISQIYDKLKNYEKEIEYGEKAIAIHIKTGNEYAAGLCYGNLGSAYKLKGNLKRSNEYAFKSLDIMRKYGDRVNEAAALNSIGINFRLEHKHEEALNYYKQAYEIAKEIDDIASEMLYAHNISCVLTVQKDYKEAERYSLVVLKNTLPANHGQLSLTYRQLATIYGYLNNGKLSQFYLDKYVDLKDSVFSKESAEQIAEMEVKYESEKKDLELSKQNAEIAIANAEVQRKNMITYSLIGLILFLLLSSYLFYNRYKLKQKAVLDAEMLKQQDIRSKAVIEAEEKERMRIARDLHDGVGQTLSAAKLNLSGLESKLQLKESEALAILKNAIDLVDDSVKEVRAVSHSMMPNALLKSGLVAAVREFINKLSTIEQLKIDLEITGLNERLESSVETVLFRVLQELVSNIIKHAKANHITIQLIKDEQELTLMIEDNGVGFDTNKKDEFSGIGLKNIVSRIEFLKGTVNFDSTRGQGTTVVIEVPV